MPVLLFVSMHMVALALTELNPSILVAVVPERTLMLCFCSIPEINYYFRHAG